MTTSNGEEQLQHWCDHFCEAVAIAFVRRPRFFLGDTWYHHNQIMSTPDNKPWFIN